MFRAAAVALHSALPCLCVPSNAPQTFNDPGDINVQAPPWVPKTDLELSALIKTAPTMFLTPTSASGFTCPSDEVSEARELMYFPIYLSRTAHLTILAIALMPAYGLLKVCLIRTARHSNRLIQTSMTVVSDAPPAQHSPVALGLIEYAKCMLAAGFDINLILADTMTPAYMYARRPRLAATATSHCNSTAPQVRIRSEVWVVQSPRDDARGDRGQARRSRARSRQRDPRQGHRLAGRARRAARPHRAHCSDRCF